MLISLEFKSLVTYSLKVEEDTVEEALDKFNKDEYDLNEANEIDSDTDWDNVEVKIEGK